MAITEGLPADPPADFDRVASVYRALELLAFGRSLEHARFAHLSALQACRDILVVGDGDGRCVDQLSRVAPQARILCIDTSDAMLALLRSRLDSTAASRVSCVRGDIREFDLPAHSYDAVLTMFVLDCLSADDVAQLVPRLARALRTNAHWLFADFALPPRGWRRVRAQLWLHLLYAFFRWRTGLAADALPPSEAIIQRAGFIAVSTTTLQHGLVRSVQFARQVAGTNSSGATDSVGGPRRD